MHTWKNFVVISFSLGALQEASYDTTFMWYALLQYQLRGCFTVFGIDWSYTLQRLMGRLENLLRTKRDTEKTENKDKNRNIKYKNIKNIYIYLRAQRRK